ncbi:hypothetical protein SKP52_13665 [Sphingopyxis fribergensis]|uniref:Uncharacterized protein n=1 Tax=Sphingopyxis fribergensis TaxID=1515612 RepID=A0A0A7PHP4_9SPHN|nr:hypothetical protein SKP52_13665 [Sphingopyxis fribergensis]
MNPVATSDAAFRGGACPTPEYTIAYTGNYTTSADANAVLLADTAEDMADPSQWAALVPLHELYAVAHWEAAYRRATMP